MVKEYNIAYIDNTNLYKGCEAEGFNVNYRKLRIYLNEKYSVKTAYIFIGYVSGNEERYRLLQEFGYTLIFKPIIKDSVGKIKGNCDAEMVLQSVKDVYEMDFNESILVTSDGDFACLARFLLKKNKLKIILSPRRPDKCSTLIKKLPAKVSYIPEIKDKIRVI